MFLTFEARTPCVLCGYQLRTWLMDGFRVNKRSLAKTGKSPSLMAGARICPECRTPATADPTAEEHFTATAETAAKVRAYRHRRWPELATEGAAA